MRGLVVVVVVLCIDCRQGEGCTWAGIAWQLSSSNSGILANPASNASAMRRL